MHLRSLAACALIATLAGTAACDKRQTAQGATRDSTAAAGLSVTSIKLGRSLNPDNTIKDNTDNFRPTDPIYAVVETKGNETGTLKARWTFEDGQVIDETSQPIAPSGAESRTEFHITKPDGWPVGRYRLELSVNGRVVDTKEFEVK
jgi:hypothetical protein